MEVSIPFRLPSLSVQKGRSEGSPASQAAPVPAESSDETLMFRIREGDSDALTELFGRYARIVRAVAYRVLHDSAEADDLLQEVFILIQRKCDLFDPSRGPARSWILAISHRCALARRRHLQSRHFYTQMDLQEIEDQISAAGDPLGGHGAVFANSALLSAFQCLSEDQRTTLHLFFVEGYTFSEIAIKLSQTQGNVKHHYFRGLEKLRKLAFNTRLRGDSAV